MNIAQRFTLFVKGSFNGLLDSVEDPERSLHQLVLDMEEQLERAKRAAAQAMANEDRLRQRIDGLAKEAAEWEGAARRALGHGCEEDARIALERAEKASRLRQQLDQQLTAQEQDSEQIRSSVTRLHEQIEGARSRLQLLQAKMRQGDARRAMGKAMRGVQKVNMMAEFERLGERVELQAAEESAYLHLDDALTGADVKRRFERQAVDDAVQERLARLRQEMPSAEDSTVAETS